MSDLYRIAGLYVGMLSPIEMREFERAIAEGRAYRQYDATALGIAKVALVPKENDDD